MCRNFDLKVDIKIREVKLVFNTNTVFKFYLRKHIKIVKRAILYFLDSMSYIYDFWKWEMSYQEIFPERPRSFGKIIRIIGPVIDVKFED